MDDKAVPETEFKVNCTINETQLKNNDYISWDEYFMAVAFLSAMRSKDPATQVGACIVNEENKILGVGYNGMPIGCNDDIMPWSRDNGDPLKNKYMYVCHAELNAVLNANTASVRGCRIYVALFPCNECAKVIIQSGIKEVIYMSDKSRDQSQNKAAKFLFLQADVSYRKFEPRQKQLVIDFYKLPE